MAEPEPRDVEPLPRGGFRCRLCRVTVANKPSLEDHLRGKKHQRLESLRAVRRTQELRSVFVSGFRKGTPASELGDYFRAFGDVVNVVMDKDKGVYAIVELESEAVLAEVLAQPQHSLGGHKLRVKPREKKDFKYGPPRKQGPARQKQPSPEELAQKLCQADDVEAQVALMVQLFEFSESERRLRDLLVTLFQEVFLEFFPGSAIIPFGSSVNSFDVSGCDLDLFLDLEKAKHFQASAKVSGAPEDAADPKVDSHPEDSLLSDVDLASATVPEVLELVAAVLQKCVPGVHNVQAVLNARCPVVKFCHKESGLRGDISINNRLALCNTRFLQLCTEADDRVRPLVYVVRYWAKQQALAGNPFGGGPLLNNYALTLLVLFFLQTCRPPILPTVDHLKERAGDGEQTTVDGWDCSFPRDSAQWDPSGNKENLCSLLAEFFHVFEDYDFSGCVISLRQGQPLPVAGFLSSSDDSSGKFKLGPFNLQDPFELSHNVAANVNKKTALRFQLCCRSAAKYCRSLQYQRKSAKGKIWGLVRLFQPGGLEAEAPPDEGLVLCLPLMGVAQPSQPPEPLGHAGGLFQKVCSSVAFVFTDVLKCRCSETQDGPGEEWPPNGSGREGETSEAKGETLPAGSKRSLEDGDDVSSPLAKRLRTCALDPSAGDSVSWDCAAWHRVWLGRRRFRRQLQAPGPEGKPRVLETEARVSEMVSQQEGGGARPPEPLLRFAARARLVAEGSSGQPDAHLRLSFAPDPGQVALFREFFHFLKHFLPQMVEQHLASQA